MAAPGSLYFGRRAGRFSLLLPGGVLHRDLAISELENYLEKLIIQEQDDTDLAETVQMLEEQSELPSSAPAAAERSAEK